ncbi:MAG TPA: hypothetical protein VHP11_17720 [Tepidisphaeraceae bacterium]|nr:hypothetical protein [Tepidisphaeraceae bacterium]
MLKIIWRWAIPVAIARQDLPGGPISHVSLLTPLDVGSATLVVGMTWVAGDLVPIRPLWVILVASGTILFSYIHLVVVLYVLRCIKRGFADL